MRQLALAVVAGVLVAPGLVCAVAQDRTAAGVKAPALNPALLAILDEHVAWSDREDPIGASKRGIDDYADKLRDESVAASERRLAEITDRRARLRALDRARFTEDDALNADLLDYELTLTIDGAKFHPEQLQIDALDGPHTHLPQLGQTTPLRTRRQREGYVARLEAIPAYLQGITEQLRAGIAAGRVPPKVVMGRVAGQLQEQATPDIFADPTKSPFYTPFLSSPQDDELAMRAREAIRERVVPAFDTFALFIADEYVPRCRESVGISEGVDGPAAYDYALRRHTTTPLTASEVHAIGLREVAALKAEMIATIRETDFDDNKRFAGDEAMLGAFVAMLREDPRFSWDDPARMVADYREIAKRIDPELPRLFGTLPRNTYGVREIPRFAAKTSPAAYYYNGSVRSGQPGYFMVNTTNMRQRTKASAISLTIHEAVPGHHFQISLADELAETNGQHPFRTLLGYTAFVEGWGLYSERLGLEMAGGEIGNAMDPPGLRPEQRGLYVDPYDNFGRLSDEVWRACRLVVDTGMHSMNWTRDRSIQYLRANSAITEHDTVSETDRYIGWPGQACAYKIGQLKILELRRRAMERLGDRFDVRRFHDAVLLGGALPLPVLESRIDRWIEAEQSR